MSKYDNPKYKPACKVCSSVGLRHFVKNAMCLCASCPVLNISILIKTLKGLGSNL